MTFATLAIGDLLDAAVMTGVLRDVARDVLVAIKAQLGLCRFPEAHMAVLAIGLEIDMASDDLAGHDRRLDVIGEGVHGRVQSEQHKPKECAPCPHRSAA
jgi:hypothetical protein